MHTNHTDYSSWTTTVKTLWAICAYPEMTSISHWRTLLMFHNSCMTSHYTVTMLPSRINIFNSDILCKNHKFSLSSQEFACLSVRLQPSVWLISAPSRFCRAAPHKFCLYCIVLLTINFWRSHPHESGRKATSWSTSRHSQADIESFCVNQFCTMYR